MSDFKQWLELNDVYVFTMNGFPYGNFHNERVKENVHTPDWTTKERLDYTQRLFNQLALLIPEGLHGGISTSPISYKHWFKTEDEKSTALKKGAEHMVVVAKQLYEIEQTTGKYLHLDIEPEPDGFLENTDEVLSFYSEYLLPTAKEILFKEFDLDSFEFEKLIKRYITICYDVCHFSLAYEEPSETFKRLDSAGILVGKIQVSAALKIIFDKGRNDEIWSLLEKFNEPTYLHQVTEKIGESVTTYNDLPIILEKKQDSKRIKGSFSCSYIFREIWSLIFNPGPNNKNLDLS